MLDFILTTFEATKLSEHTRMIGKYTKGSTFEHFMGKIFGTFEHLAKNTRKTAEIRTWESFQKTISLILKKIRSQKSLCNKKLSMLQDFANKINR